MLYLLFIPVLIYNDDSKVAFKKKLHSIYFHSKFSTFRTDFCRILQLPYGFSLISLHPILHGFSHDPHRMVYEVRIKQKNPLHEEFNLSERDVV